MNVIIRAKFNLCCSKGHYHYSPTPKVWAGMTCGKPLGSSNTRNVRRCDAPMKPTGKRDIR